MKREAKEMKGRREEAGLYQIDLCIMHDLLAITANAIPDNSEGYPRLPGR